MIGILVGNSINFLLTNYWDSVLRLSLSWLVLAALAWWMGAV